MLTAVQRDKGETIAAKCASRVGNHCEPGIWLYRLNGLMATTVNLLRTSNVAKSARGATPRQDRLALWVGLAFSVLFTGLIWLLGSRLAEIPHLPDTGASWYYWQLPERTFWGRVTAWGFYLAHQVAIWWLIFAAQRARSRYSTTLHWFNYAALGINAVFIVLHLLQTHIWYDGLAQDVSIWSSQWSVILLLVVILMMENPRRGMFFGVKAPLSRRVVDFVRKYHGYYFAWATIYTFWYHPMEGLSGHLVGFFYMFLLLLQGSLFFTRIHLNRYWTFAQEAMVLIHGVLVAWMNANDLWPMFGFGFAGLIVVTQLHGLGLSRPLRAGVVAIYVGAALWVYSLRDLADLHQITWIPLTEYATVYALAGLIGLGLWVAQKIGGRTTDKEAAA